MPQVLTRQVRSHHDESDPPCPLGGSSNYRAVRKSDLQGEDKEAAGTLRQAGVRRKVSPGWKRGAVWIVGLET